MQSPELKRFCLSQFQAHSFSEHLTHEDAALTASLYPCLPTPSHACRIHPAEATETASGTAIGAHADEGITLLGCLQRIRHAVLAFMSATADTAVRRYQ